MTSTIESQVRDEIEALHRFFVDWFTGAAPNDAIETDFLNRFDPDFLLIPSGGTILTLDAFESTLRLSHGTNPDFRIAIRNVTIRRNLDDCIVATYEEWQRNALASTPPDNARIATVLFKRARPLRWLHVHETRLPDSIVTAGPYDF
jgi:hypothetical protein